MAPRPNRPLKTDDLAQTSEPTPTDAVPGEVSAVVPEPAATAATDSGPADVDTPGAPLAPEAAAAPEAEPADGDAGQSDRPEEKSEAVIEAEESYQQNQRRAQVRPLTIDLES